MSRRAATDLGLDDVLERVLPACRVDASVVADGELFPTPDYRAGAALYWSERTIRDWVSAYGLMRIVCRPRQLEKLMRFMDDVDEIEGPETDLGFWRRRAAQQRFIDLQLARVFPP